MAKLVNKKLIRSFCFAYMTMHLLVAAFSIRVWPFTDYPMFSHPFYKGHDFFNYNYSALMADGSVHPLERAFATGFGIGETNLTNLLEIGDLAMVKKILSQWYLRQYNKDDIAAILIFRIVAIPPPDSKSELIIKETLAYKIPKEELL